nr:fatty acyl-AMP ligase [Nocardia brasiliensis]
MPEKVAIRYVPDLAALSVSEELTYRKLCERALTIGIWLVRNGFRPGDRALLVFDRPVAFAEAFFACAWAGVIAVPAPVPGPSRTGRERLTGIVADAEPSVVLCDGRGASGFQDWALRTGSGSLPVCDVRSLQTPVEFDRVTPFARADDVLLLQYTSGSTREPKGVVVTNANVVANLNVIRTRLGGGLGRGACGWLPLTHDMGLLGQLLFPLFTGGWVCLTSPSEFVRRPLGWLSLMSRYRADLATAPDFAYALCTRAGRDNPVVSTLDLSSWRQALNGAEPVRADTLTAFAAEFGKAGFAAEALTPTYGLAEATLMVSAKPSGTMPTVLTVDHDALARGAVEPVAPGERARRIVSCGEYEPGTVAIVDPNTRVARDAARIGEIWVSGPCVAQGYWKQSSQSAESFDAMTADGRGGYLRTGDLGFVSSGTLYVTGRIKDVIVVRGRNLYPHDLEDTVRGAAGGLSLGRSVVLGMDDEPGVIVIQELSDDDPEEGVLAAAAARIRRALIQDFGVGRSSVLFVPPRTVRLTTSGKVRRSLMKQLFLESELNPIYQAMAPEPRVEKEER